MARDKLLNGNILYGLVQVILDAFEFAPGGLVDDRGVGHR